MNTRNFCACRQRKNERGQTLILGVLALIILALAVVFLFDLQSVIKSKVKGQNAVDAAALAGANWQRHSLNLIGELNLVKACTVLISEIPDSQAIPGDFLEDEEDLDEVRYASDLLSEMQARISYVGPMIGFGAAQQAAKNNGLNYNLDSERRLQYLEHYEAILDDSLYGEEFTSQELQGYYWREPYAAMLLDILEYNGSMVKGLTVYPSDRLMDSPDLVSDSPIFSWLTNESTYAAINARYWCYIRDLIRDDYFEEESKWWGDIELVSDSISPRGSEFMPLNIEFFEGTAPYTSADDSGALDAVLGEEGRESLDKLRDNYDNLNPGDVGDDGFWDPLPEITWATFDSTDAMNDHWSWSDYGTSRDDWRDEYLRADFKDGFDYFSGAICRVDASFPPQVLTGAWGDEDDEAYIGDALAFGGSDDAGQVINAFAGRMASAEEDINEMAQERESTQWVELFSVAKPFGRIETASNGFLYPHSAGMVLPVFERAIIIPKVLENPGQSQMYNYRWRYFLTEYLPTLGTVDNIGDMPQAIIDAGYGDHWSYFQTYHNALVLLNSASFREEGIAWLDTVIQWEYTYNEFGEVIGQEPVMTNEDTCDFWASGPGGGPRSGPGVLF